ncbi:MAG: TetR/AcrR family transcriptional regulator [Polyangiaceae bacterium]|nr:TetR/AcrR family transcriptional regulator [Polyangiaceae bacterium]
MSSFGHDVQTRARPKSGAATAGRAMNAPRDERAHRILDTAGALILRWGYDKTSIDDIARTAGVAKGTVYLHWKSRDALFVALLRRERVELLGEVVEQLAGTPSPATLPDLLKHFALAVLRRPLLKAVLLRDMSVIGKLARRERGDEARDRLQDGFVRYLKELRELGLVRADVTMGAQASLVASLMVGFFVAPPMMPKALSSSEDELADLLADTVRRAFDPGKRQSKADIEAGSRATRRYVEDALETAHQKLAIALSGPQAADEEVQR